MASGYLSAELTATCNALGYYDGQTYHLEPHCAETAKDLIRYLRRDDDSHEIRRFCGNTKIVQTDLLPIIQCHSDNQELFDVVLRLLVNLTNPAFLVYKEVLPKDKTVRNQYLELVSHLQVAKEAFTQHKPWDVIAEKLSILLNTPDYERDDDVRRNIERILILVRNVLHVTDSEGESRPDNDASIHDQVLWALHQSSMLDLILYIASTPQEECFYMHILEIICLMVREQPASLLAQAASTRSNEEKSKDSDELHAIRKRECISNQQKIRKYQGMRNFGGTYVIKNMKSTSDKDIIYHKPLQNLTKISLNLEKKKVKIPRNRQPLKCHNVERKSALSVRLILKQFCIEILNGAYNPLMKSVKDSLVRGKTQDNDESYYFNAMTFFMEFNRNYKFQVKFVSETLSVESFHFIHKYLETWHEMMVTDKGKIHLWSSRMHLALKSYKELLYNLMEMDKNEDEGVRESSRVIKSNIFYVLEYREMLLMLMKSYKKPKFSLKYLCDLIETVHVFLKLLEHFGKNKKLFVQKKTSRPRKKNKKAGKQSQKANMEDLWTSISPDLLSAIESPVNKEVFPFDAASNEPMNQQKITAVKKIQNLLKSGDFEEAVAFLRASREIWPENDTFGGAECSPDEELICFKEVFLADLDTGFSADYDDAPLSEEEEDDYSRPIEERSFDVDEFIKSFANPRVVYICGLLLHSFETNTKMVNHCVAKMLHRIAWDCKLPSMIFQASIFRSFMRILASHNPSHKELATLAKFVVRKFVEVASVNKKLLIELLFWKSAKDCYDIEVGYGSYQEKSKAAKIMWEEHEEDELRRLYMEYKEKFPDQEMTSDNVVPWITSNLIKERTERAVAKKLKEMCLVVAKSKKKPLWSPEEEDQLKTLFEEFRGSDDAVGKILERMPNRSRRIINSTLLRLGVVHDRSELKPKKKAKGRRPRKDDSPNRSESDHSDSSSDEDDNDRGDLNEERNKQRETLSRPLISKSIHELINFSSARTYLLEGVEWLSESMKDNLEDCEDDSTEVPLLPLSESAIKSIDDQLFQNMLLSLGLFSPFQQQEMYWRFPGTWKSKDYSIRIDLIAKVIEHMQDDSHQVSNDLRNYIIDKFNERIPRSFDDFDDSSEDDQPNNTKDDFDSVVARQCQETLNSYNSRPVNQPSNNSLLYSKSDDESHEKTEVKSFKKSNKLISVRSQSSSDDDSDNVTKNASKNEFMSKVKALSKNKLNLETVITNNDASPVRPSKNNDLNSDSESDKENDSSNVEHVKAVSPLSEVKSNRSRIQLQSDDSDVESNNSSDDGEKSEINSVNIRKLNSEDSDSDISKSESVKFNMKKKRDSHVMCKKNRIRLLSDSDDSGSERSSSGLNFAIQNNPSDSTSLTLGSEIGKNKKLNPADYNKEPIELMEEENVPSIQKRSRISLESDDDEVGTRNVSVNKKIHFIDSDED